MVADILEMDIDRIFKLLEVPKNTDLGDFALPCFHFAKELKKAPQQISELIAKQIKKNKYFSQINYQGPYLNFEINQDRLAESVLKEIYTKKEKYGHSDIGRKKTVVIDFSSPNIAKPFGVGHLRSTIIGNSLAKMFYFLGYEVHGVNHLGDWGTQFGKLMVAYKKWGDEKVQEKTPIQHM